MAALATKQKPVSIAVRLADVVSAVNRVLIDWEVGAEGIWTILPDEERSETAPTCGYFSYQRNPEAELLPPRPWSGKLFMDLVDALKKWNDLGEELFSPFAPDFDDATFQAKEDAFRFRAAELAAWTQRELGPDFEVLFVTSNDAWQWARPPWTR